MKKVLVIILIGLYLFSIVGFAIADNNDEDKNSGNSKSGDSDSKSNVESSNNDNGNSKENKDSKESEEGNKGNGEDNKDIEKSKEKEYNFKNKNGEKTETKIKEKFEEDGKEIELEIKKKIIDVNGNEREIEIEIEIEEENGIISRKIKIKVESEEFEAKTKLEIKGFVEDQTGEEIIQAILSNGTEKEINVMPDKIFELAEKILGSENLSIELKETKQKLMYSVETEKEARVFGIFKIKIKMRGEFDPETGEFLDVKKPWWSIFAPGANDVEICHIPPGNPDNEQTINIGAPAVKAHLAHGDYLGECEQEQEPPENETEIPENETEVLPTTNSTNNETLNLTV